MSAPRVFALDGQARVVAAGLILAGAILRLSLWPIYRSQFAALNDTIDAKAAELDTVQALIGRTRPWKDSLSALRERAAAMQKVHGGGLDAIQREGIRGMRTIADSAGVSIEGIVVDQYSTRSRESCRREPCVRLVTLRGTFTGTTESVVDLIASLDDTAHHYAVRELLIQAQPGSGPMGGPSRLRVEAAVAVAGMTTAQARR